MSFISISDIISGYITDKSTDTISSIFSKISQSEQIKKNIDEQLKEELNKFQAASKNEEFDFEALQNFVKKFSDKSFINDYAKYSITKTELEKAQEHLFIECTQATHAETTDAQNTIKSILNNCFKIVEYQLILELSKEDLTQICLINKYTEGSAIKSVNDINKHGDENTKKIINEIKIIKNELIPSPTSSSSNNELSFDTLKVGRELSAEYLKNLITYGRFKGYDETNKERITIKNKLKTEKNSKKEYDLSEIVFSSSENIDKDCNISIHGVGGTGKTFQLISLYESIISNSTSPYNHTIPFYIELNNLNTNNSILLDELKSSLENDNVTTLKMEHLIKILKEQGRNVILMLDGYNEVTKEKLREEIAKQICKIIRDYKTRILITSRFDHSDMFQRINRGSTASFIQAEIQPCSPSQINIYFQKLKIYNKKFQNLQGYEKRLVKTAQGLSMYGALLKNNPKHKIENLGTLLREYVNNILLSDVKDTKFENYLEEIAYHMVLEGSFQIEPYELKEFLNKKYNNNTYDIVINDPNIQKLFVKDSKDNFEFTHQNFRDMYCALHFNKLLSNITKNFSGFKGNNITTNDEILQLCGDLIKNDQIIQKSINKLKEIQKNINKAIISNTDYSFALQVLIKIFSFKNKNNIHSLDLSTLDLSKVSLSGYILYQNDVLY